MEGSLPVNGVKGICGIHQDATVSPTVLTIVLLLYYLRSHLLYYLLYLPEFPHMLMICKFPFNSESFYVHIKW